VNTFTTDVTGLRDATRFEVIVLDHGAELTLRPGPVAKRLGDATVRMLGYNDSIPGPTLKVRQGSEIVVHVIHPRHERSRGPDVRPHRRRLG
jgi:multicopper oxidase